MHKKHRYTYGSPRLTTALKKADISRSKNRVARLMRENNIYAKTKRKFKATTDSHHGAMWTSGFYAGPLLSTLVTRLPGGRSSSSTRVPVRRK